MNTAETADLVVKIVGILGAAIGFWWGIRQWRESQRWKRAERLDTFIREFDTTPLLRFASKVIDWEAARIEFAPGDAIEWRSQNVRDAMRIHWNEPPDVTYPPPQDRIRDALDALLTFFVRLYHEVSVDLVEEAPAVEHFAYWLFRLKTMNEHGTLENPQVAEAAMTEYIKAYSNPRVMNLLFSRAERCETYKNLQENVRAAKPKVLGVKVIGLPELYSSTMIINEKRKRKPTEGGSRLRT